MKSVTIHKLDSELANAIETIAKTTGLSQNKVIKKLLRKALGITERNQPKRDLSEIFGTWSEEEGKAFEKSIEIFEKIDVKQNN